MSDKFKIGDKVTHKHYGKEGVIVEMVNSVWVTVIHEEEHFFWDRDSIEVKSEKVPWIPCIKQQLKIICRCQSRDLFHYGCRCGAFDKEKNEVQG